MNDKPTTKIPALDKPTILILELDSSEDVIALLEHLIQLLRERKRIQVAISEGPRS